MSRLISQIRSIFSEMDYASRRAFDLRTGTTTVTPRRPMFVPADWVAEFEEHQG